MPRQTEPNANNALGSLLQDMLPRSQVRSENTQAISGHPGLRPDIIVTAPGRSPVVVEAEYMPARTVEPEARERLGLEVAANGRIIEAAIALRYPDAIGDAHDLRAALSAARLEHCVFTEHDGETRFPESGWLDGSVEDLADMVRLVSEPQRAVDEATNTLQQGIDGAAKLLDELNETRSGITLAIARLLGMTNVRQTRRMACAIIANALVFHERIAGMHDEVKPLALVCGDGVPNPQGEVIAAWDDILDINYWAIFAIARDILQQLPSADAANILRRLRNTAQSVNATGVDNAHDLTGRIFQRLIADRKYLATFYTLPASAALLARLAVAKLPNVDWSSPEAIGKLRIGDFACGTGALLSAVYEQIAARHERAGGDASALHKVMMEDVLYGCDVMPSAVHITGSTLSGVEPSVLFNSSRLYTMPYGRMNDDSVMIGSLELLQSSDVLTLFNTSDPAMRTGSAGEETAAQIRAEIPDDSFDVVIMNPPFTSDTKHRDAEDGVLNAAFAAFAATDNDQKDMAKRLKRLAEGNSYHGHAGLGSAFAALAARKMRPNGVIALVLPFTAINGSSWAKFRELIATQYTDVTILSIAANGRDMSFSSDTDIGECLVIGRKLAGSEKPGGRGTFISLRRKPASFVDAQGLSRVVLSTTTLRRLEDGPYGGLPIYRGDAVAGEILDAPLDSHKTGWGAARILDASVAQTAHSLSDGKLRLPAESKVHQLSMVRLDEIGELGVHDSYLTMKTHKGPFRKESASPTATYPSLYNHDAKKETRLTCNPDSQLRVLPGMEERADELWTTASRSHISRGFRFNSQPLAVAFTEQESLGGRAWPNVSFSDVRFDYAFSIWLNSTLGMLSYWWHSSRQQAGRGEMTRLGIRSLPVPDFRTLSDTQLQMADDIFNELRDKELKPAYLADADPNRALLDRRVICDLLGLRRRSLRRRPPPHRQVVRRTIRPRRQAPPQERQADYPATARVRHQRTRNRHVRDEQRPPVKQDTQREKANGQRAPRPTRQAHRRLHGSLSFRSRRQRSVLPQTCKQQLPRSPRIGRLE